MKNKITKNFKNVQPSPLKSKNATPKKSTNTSLSPIAKGLRSKPSSNVNLKHEQLRRNSNTPNTANSSNNVGSNFQSNLNFEISELMYNVNDDQKTLINKNSKLRNLLVQASAKLSECSLKFKLKEEESQKEKSEILEELEKISINYKTYAEGYKHYSQLEEQLKNLKNDYQHNYNVLNSYGESLSLFLKDYMTMFKLLTSFLSGGNPNSKSQSFLFDLKALMLNNLKKYKSTIDVLNFREIFDEYNAIINNQYSNFLSRSPTSSEQVRLNKFKSEKMTNNKSSDISPLKKERSKSPIKNNYTGDLPLKNTNLSPGANHKRNKSFDAVIDKKVKCIEYIESRVKNYFDQKTTKNELKDLTEEIQSNFDKINNNLIISKDSLNSSKVSNVFEKSPGKKEDKLDFRIKNTKEKNFISSSKNCRRGQVIKDFIKQNEGEITCSLGDKVKILTSNRKKGFVYVILEDDNRGWVAENFIRIDS